GKQERAPLILRQSALELPAHQRMQLGVLVDRAIDAHKQSLRLERGEVRLEIERRSGGARSRRPTRIGADVEHGRDLLVSPQRTICRDCNAMLSVYRRPPRCAVPGIRPWARSISAPASRASKIRPC